MSIKGVDSKELWRRDAARREAEWVAVQPELDRFRELPDEKRAKQAEMDEIRNRRFTPEPDSEESKALLAWATSIELSAREGLRFQRWREQCNEEPNH